MLESSGSATGFLFQFARGTDSRVLTRIEAACGNLVDVTIGGVSILANQQDLRIVAARIIQERHHGTGARMTKNLDLAGGAIGKLDDVHIEVDDLACVDPLAGALAERHRAIRLSNRISPMASADNGSAIDGSPTTTTCIFL